MSIEFIKLKILNFLLIITTFIVLTVLTQIGGIIYLLSRTTNKWSDQITKSSALRYVIRSLVFVLIYLAATFLIVPPVAKAFGRVRLPISESDHLQPLNILTCFLNRNYVRTKLRETAISVAKEMNKQYPGTVTNYLDANFPFINKFPLFPHLSHNDGKKLDLAFFYTDVPGGQQSDQAPSIIGYGICEEPLPVEVNTAEFCDQKGYWQYSFLKKIVPQGDKKKLAFDPERTRSIVNLFAKHDPVGKIFIEPHLKKRLGLNSEKIRFHGCGAVRHDDHIHIQLK